MVNVEIPRVVTAAVVRRLGLTDPLEQCCDIGRGYRNLYGNNGEKLPPRPVRTVDRTIKVDPQHMLVGVTYSTHLANQKHSFIERPDGTVDWYEIR